MADPFAEGADQLLAALGASVTYRSLLSGTLALTAIIDQGVEVLDEGAGAYVRRTMATIKSGLVTPKRGDVIETATARYSVQQIDASTDEYLTHLLVQRNP